ncbi:hypothetical protein CEXT_253411 [Caerostris extrusa]|uniref:Uncharacterized protein n=1 Tax=Caerostris extrusa TaxID=172846 RepID=A0AAV4VIG0_CAEEX|nr:hypothetical protein CEXT_253411 [Caerostris extrusa]
MAVERQNQIKQALVRCDANNLFFLPPGRSVHRRDLPVPAEPAVGGGGEEALRAHDVRQRTEAAHLEGVQDQVPHRNHATQHGREQPRVGCCTRL